MEIFQVWNFGKVDLLLIRYSLVDLERRVKFSKITFKGMMCAIFEEKSVGMIEIITLLYNL